MRRRAFIMLLGGAAAAWPRAARAQQPAIGSVQTADAIPRIGVMMATPESDPVTQARVSALRQGLQALGWIEGRNIRIEYRWDIGGPDRARASAKELIALTPNVILPSTTPMLAAVRQETQSLPILFVNVSDPVGTGLVESLARPRGNVTGFTNFEYAIGTKWLQLLKQIAPEVTRVAVIANPRNPNTKLYLSAIEPAAPAAGLDLIMAGVNTAVDIEHAMASFAREPKGGLLVVPDPITISYRDTIIAQAAQHRLAAVYAYRFFAVSGGLLAYGTDTDDLFRRAASYVDRILKGAKPGDLPIQQPTKYELVINIKTARALGISIPPDLLALADEVIE
jgi:putative tryptophan/tyrosine transport system substrate-binding protein